MKLAIAMLVFVSALAASAAPVRAQEQTQAPAPSTEPRSAELAKWLKEYREWEKWFEQWGNRVQKNYNNDQIWTRKKRPEPPAWLQGACQDDLVFDEQMATACNILITWDEEPMQIMRRRDSPVTTSAGKPADNSREEFVLSTGPPDWVVDAGTISRHAGLRDHRDAGCGVGDRTIHAPCHGRDARHGS